MWCSVVCCLIAYLSLKFEVITATQILRGLKYLFCSYGFYTLRKFEGSCPYVKAWLALDVDRLD